MSKKDLEIEPTAEHNKANVVKANKRVAAAMAKYSKYKQPQRKKCFCIGFSRSNRKSNMAYIHNNLSNGLKKDGFSPERAGIGFIVEYDNPKDIKDLVAFNIEESSGSDLYPPVRADCMDSETLSSQHLTTAFRLFDAGGVSSMSGCVFEVPDDDNEFQYVMANGHDYYHFVSATPDEERIFLATWKNSAQNMDSMLNFAELIYAIQRYCKAEERVAKV